MIKDYMRKDLADFRPYHSPLKPYQVKIDANENPYAHSDQVIAKIQEWVQNKDNLTRYPDTDINALREKLSEIHKVDKDEVICTVGSDQLIELIIKVFVEPGEVALVPNPSFSMYTLSTVLNHGKAVPYELDDDFNYDYEALISAYKLCQPKLVFICTPNNPTGNKATIEDMIQVLDTVKCPVIVDEAYEEFIGESMMQYIDQYPQLIVLRTFSKAYGIAGLRIGYGVANKEMIDMIGVAKPPYNVSSFSQAVAGFILDDLDYYKEQVKTISSNRDQLMKDLESKEVIERVYPSSANFILVKVKDDQLTEYLANQQMLVRGYNNVGRLAHHIRITVGTEEENRQLLSLLDTYKL